mgnify:CR=1 FL=1
MIELNVDNVFVLICVLSVVYGTYWLTTKKDNDND